MAPIKPKKQELNNTIEEFDEEFEDEEYYGDANDFSHHIDVPSTSSAPATPTALAPKENSKPTKANHMNPDDMLTLVQNASRMLEDKPNPNRNGMVRYFRFPTEAEFLSSSGRKYTSPQLRSEFMYYWNFMASKMAMPILPALRMMEAFLCTSESAELFPDYPQLAKSNMNSYSLFMTKTAKKMKKDHPEYTLKEKAKALGEMWRSHLDVQEKYREKMKILKQAEQVEMDEFYERHPRLQIIPSKQVEKIVITADSDMPRPTSNGKRKRAASTNPSTSNHTAKRSTVYRKTAYDCFRDIKGEKYSDLPFADREDKLRRKFQKISDGRMEKYAKMAQDWNDVNIVE